MSKFKIFGSFFMLIGVFFFVAGIVGIIQSHQKEEFRIYTVATIVEIEEYVTGDSENPIGHRTYVECEMKGEKSVYLLNTYSSRNHKVGKEIEIYYFEDDTSMVYEKGRERFLFGVFLCMGGMVAVVGGFFGFNKKLQSFLDRMPSSEM